MAVPVIHRVTTLDLRVRAMAMAVRGPAARRDRRAFRGRAAREAADLERPRAARPQPGLCRRASSAPIISRPISPASWPGATGVFRTGACSTALAWARCAAPTARSCSAKWASTPQTPGASISRPARPISMMSADGRLDIAGSVAREVEEETGLTPRITAPTRIGIASAPASAIAMMRVLHVDMPGEALRARIEANLARQQQPELRGDPSGARDRRS